MDCIFGGGYFTILLNISANKATNYTQFPSISTISDPSQKIELKLLRVISIDYLRDRFDLRIKEKGGLTIKFWESILILTESY